jgi:hypothetical protein
MNEQPVLTLLEEQVPLVYEKEQLLSSVVHQ